jgi:hemerythrin-like domain-containing protein
MDAITLLKEDHQEVSKMFKEFEGLGDGASASKQKIVEQIIEELTKHAHVEETIFYPFARQNVEDVDEDIDESVQEHHVIKVTLAELAAMSSEDDEFDAKVTVLKEVVEHHVKEEEEEWFPKVRDAIGRNDLGDVGEKMESAKESAPTTPDPSS